MPKAQMHFEVDQELKAHWKAFFANLPRKSETRVLTELVRNFLEKAKTQYKEEQDNAPFPCSKCGGEVGHRINCPDGIAFSNIKEAQNDPGTSAMDQPSNRAGAYDEPGVEVSGSDAGICTEANPQGEKFGS